ncbi:MAG TPA: hypothetical protein VK703_01130, partial [Candidatus Acidoferrales bacterium]|nr:hypothetical protein [Candidatus Acidoferrales bacterium]
MASASPSLAVCHQLAVYLHPVVGQVACRYPAVFRPGDDTVAALREAADANLPAVAAEVAVAGNTVADNPAGNPDNSHPTNTDSRNTASRRNKPSGLPSSYAIRYNPIRNSSC